MRAAFFHDHVFGRDAAGVHYSNGSLPYAVLARYVAQFGHLVVVGRLRESGPMTRSIADGHGVQMACMQDADPWHLLAGVGAPMRHVRGVLSTVDCAIVRLPSAIGVIACREAIRMGVPWMAEVVGCGWDALWYHGSLAGKVLAPRSYLLNRTYVARAPYALYVTERFLQRRYPSRGETVGCSDVTVDHPREDVLERRLARIDAGPPHRRITLGLVGSSDVEYKGHDTALDALSLLARSGLNVTLRCLGGGDPSRWRRRARALDIADRVEFTGALPHGDAVLEWLDGLDVFLIPSLTEGLPRALVEAMSRGVPAIGTHTGGIPELLGPECTHPRRDHRRLAALVGRLVRDHDEMKRWARRNWRVAHDFAADVLGARRDAFLGRFREFAARGGSGRTSDAGLGSDLPRSGALSPSTATTGRWSEPPECSSVAARTAKRRSPKKM